VNYYGGYSQEDLAELWSIHQAVSPELERMTAENEARQIGDLFAPKFSLLDIAEWFDRSYQERVASGEVQPTGNTVSISDMIAQDVAELDADD